MSFISSFPGGLQQYLSTHKVSKGNTFTHKALSSPTTSIYVADEDTEVFHALYANAISEGEKVYLTEKHSLTSPVLIDVDLIFQPTIHANKNRGLGLEKRRYTDQDVLDIVQVYGNVLMEFITTTDFSFFTFEKKQPRLENNLIKDGFHLMVPDVVATHALHFLVRAKVLEGIAHIFKRMGTTNSVSDIVDEAVIMKNNWSMYGSEEPEGEAYQLTKIFRYHHNNKGATVTIIPRPNTLKTALQLVTFFSIRNKNVNCVINQDKIQEVASYSKALHAKQNNKNLCRSMIGELCNGAVNECNNLETVKKLVNILNFRRSYSYDTWITLGWCLRNIDHRLFDTWDEFSKDSAKYDKYECKRVWTYMTVTQGLTIGTLRMWAKIDNPSEYAEIASIEMNELLYLSCDATHLGVAKVIHFLLENEFVCASTKQHIWYQFINHKWSLCNGTNELKVAMNERVIALYEKEALEHGLKAASSKIACEAKRYMAIQAMLNKITHNLSDNTYQKQVVSTCENLFYMKEFRDKLDSHTNLLCFKNGVYDLNIDSFRDGKPDDYISLCTDIKFIKLDPNHEIVIAIRTYLSQVMPATLVREYVMRVVASFLSGTTLDHKFYIWTGSGSNSKSIFVDLIRKCMGRYACLFPVTLVTGKRAVSNACSPEIAASKGKRLAVMSEPDKSDKLNMGLIKELTGGDTIYARALYTEPIEFKPQFKPLMLCNDLPKVDDTDDGSWRRLRPVGFISKFVETPVGLNEFPLDITFPTKMGDWPEHFMAILLFVYFPKFRDEGIVEPQEVKDSTNKYRGFNSQNMICNLI